MNFFNKSVLTCFGIVVVCGLIGGTAAHFFFGLAGVIATVCYSVIGSATIMFLMGADRKRYGDDPEKEAHNVYIVKNNLYVIVRTCSAGVHAGTLVSRKGKEVVLKNTRRIWFWNGAASLSEMAISGVKKPCECKFSVTIPENTLTEAIEIMPCTKTSIASIKGVPEWTA
jgi:hypothetical protein